MESWTLRYEGWMTLLVGLRLSCSPPMIMIHAPLFFWVSAGHGKCPQKRQFSRGRRVETQNWRHVFGIRFVIVLQ